MADINQAGRVMQQNIAASKLWRKLRADYKASQVVDKEHGANLQKALAGLEKIKNDELESRTEQDVELASALRLLPLMLNGASKVRPGGAEPLIAQLKQMLGEDLDECMASDMDMEVQVNEISDLIKMCSIVPGMDNVIAKSAAFNASMLEKYCSQSFSPPEVGTYGQGICDDIASNLAGLRGVRVDTSRGQRAFEHTHLALRGHGC